MEVPRTSEWESSGTQPFRVPPPPAATFYNAGRLMPLAFMPVVILSTVLWSSAQSSTSAADNNSASPSVAARSVIDVQPESADQPAPAGEPDHHDQPGHHEVSAQIERPKVFLDKSPRIVEYQLKRLDNRRLVLVERNTSHGRYRPVYRAILLRPGMARSDRDEALQALVVLNETSAVTEILSGLESLDMRKKDQLAAGRQLSELLLEQTPEQLQADAEGLRNAAGSKSSLVCMAGFCGMLLADSLEEARKIADGSDQSTISWLEAVDLLSSASTSSSENPHRRIALRTQVVELLSSGPSRDVTNVCLKTLAHIPEMQADSYVRISEFIDDAVLRPTAVHALLEIPPEVRDSAVSSRLAVKLVSLAEQTATADRTSDAFLDMAQLIDQLLLQLSTADARDLRERMRSVAVRLVRIRTLHDQMRYDVPYFAVEAGRSVQLLLQNDDLMPHNLVVTRPGMLKSVAEAGAAQGTSPGFQGLPYVPQTDQVLLATSMVEPGKSERLTFTAPESPGEYPFVCTFPRHWMRMYGVMIVVPDLDAWGRSPTVPADPLGNTRAFVRRWALTDFGGDPAVSLQDRREDIGARLFREATCVQCHQYRGTGGNAGPDLTDVLSRWKGDYRGVLREILDPSWKIDPRFAVHSFLTRDGKTLTGIIRSEDEQSYGILSSPEARELMTVNKSDVEEVVPTSTSMMPRSLLDQFSRDEILELLAYICSPAPQLP